MNIGGFTLNNRIWHDFTNEWIWDDMGLSLKMRQKMPQMTNGHVQSRWWWKPVDLGDSPDASLPSAMLRSCSPQWTAKSWNAQEASLGDLELEKSFFSYDWNACCVCHKTWRKECRCFSPKAEHGDILEDVGNPKVNVGHENGNKGPELLMASSCTAVHDEIMMLGLCSYRLARFLGSSSTFSWAISMFHDGIPIPLEENDMFQTTNQLASLMCAHDNPWLVG